MRERSHVDTYKESEINQGQVQSMRLYEECGGSVKDYENNEVGLKVTCKNGVPKCTTSCNDDVDETSRML